MQQTKKELFLKECAEAVAQFKNEETDKEYFAVLKTISTTPYKSAMEIIKTAGTVAGIEEKINYISSAYDDDLTHKNNSLVKIQEFAIYLIDKI